MKEDDEILIEHISMNDKQKMMQAKEIRIDVFVKEQDVDIDAVVNEIVKRLRSM